MAGYSLYSMSCLNWENDACTPAEAEYWTQLGQRLGLTDFDPTQVNWNKPTTWTDDGDCDMDNQDGCMMPLSAGFAIVLGFGAFFSIFTTLLVFLEKKFGNVEITSEHFNTAGRSVKTGLTASVIVSQWTWAATLLQSSNVAWSYGISGPFWYAAGASIQVLLFGILAIEVKRKVPNAHTFLEIVDVRWGKTAHLVFMFFAFCTNILVTGMLLLGGAAVMEAVSGMDRQLACFLIPWGVILYTFTGGLKATFLASYIHTAIIFVGLVIFIMIVYADGTSCPDDEQCNRIGSANILYERLQFNTEIGAQEPAVRPAGFVAPEGMHQGPVKDNAKGSYLTMLSSDGLMFGVINIVGNFGTVFVDQSYWQSAIAASPASAHKGYLLGGLVWFTIPFALATSLGLASNALNANITGDDANAGLVPPAAAIILIGDGGGVLVIIMLFMAITSTGSAECIAVSSLVTYDIYRKYINPAADGKKILFISRIFVVAFGLVMGILGVLLNAFETPDGGKVSLGWVYLFMGIVIGSAVMPVSFLLLWDKACAEGAIAGALIGQVCAFITWIITASQCKEWEDSEDMSADCKDGKVNYNTLGMNEPMLAGNVVAILLSGLVCTIVSLLKPQNFDWSKLKDGIKRVDGGDADDVEAWETDDKFLLESKEWIMKWGWIWTIGLIMIWPAATVPWGVLSKSLYGIWASVAFIWGWLAAIIIISLPLWENRKTILAVLTWTPAEPEPASYNKTTSSEQVATAQA